MRANTLADVTRFFKIGDACWLWFGPRAVNKYGPCYGQIKIKGKMYQAHRAMYEHHYGVKPGQMDVLHKCDVPNCVRPSHLFLGTHSDNMRDMIAKRRRNFNGERGPAAKVTNAQALAIRRDKRSGAQLAPVYGLTKGAINKIKRRATFRDI